MGCSSSRAGSAEGCVGRHQQACNSALLAGCMCHHLVRSLRWSLPRVTDKDRFIEVAVKNVMSQVSGEEQPELTTLLLQDGNQEDDMETDCSDFESEDDGPQQPTKASRTAGGGAAGGGAGGWLQFCPACCTCAGMLCHNLAAAADCGHSCECPCEGFWGQQAPGSVRVPGKLDGIGRLAYTPTTSTQICPCLNRHPSWTQACW